MKAAKAMKGMQVPDAMKVVRVGATDDSFAFNARDTPDHAGRMKISRRKIIRRV